MARNPKVLIGGIGYRNLRDHSVGVAVAEHLSLREWPEGVRIEDVSYGPIAVLQRLQDEPPDEPFDRVILVSAVPRGREPGAISAYRWDGVLPSEALIQRAVNDAVTGVIFLDNTIVVTAYFGGLRGDVVVVEIEPEHHEFGDRFGPAVAAAFDELCETVTRLAISPEAVAALEVAPLGTGLAPLELR